MIQNSAFFIILLIIRLILFFWNLATEKKPYSNTSQSVMMLVTAITLYLTNTILAISIVQFVSARVDNMKFPNHTLISIAYGLFTLGKLILWIFGIKKKRKINRYLETLSYLGWYSAFYSLAVLLVYLLYSGSEGKNTDALMVIFWTALASTIVLAIIMTVRSTKSLWKIRKEMQLPTGN